MLNFSNNTRNTGLIIIAAILLSCQSVGPLPPAPTLPPPSTAEPAPASTTVPDLEPAGQLAYIGADGNVYVTTANPGHKVAVTDDATAEAEGAGLSYHRLAWSPDGRLAFAAVTRTGNDAQSTLYVTDAPGEHARVVGKSDDHFVIYNYWSPVPCPGQPTCRRLAYLIEEEDGVGLHIVEMHSGEIENILVETGRPFYFSWSPDGRRILWHTGGAGRHNPDARIGLYDVQEDRTQTVSENPGLFHAPIWSPTGERWLGVVGNNQTDHLRVFRSLEQDSEEVRGITTLASAPDRRIAFAWSPAGDKIAYAVQKDVNDAFYGPIHVYDLSTGQSRRVTIPAFDISGFFWSPDGRRIGYLSRLTLPDAIWQQWRTYDILRDKDRGFAAFHPSPLMNFTIHSFNQYTQSHRFWSPDGRYLVYAERDDRTLTDHVWLIDTWAEKGTDPILVDEGGFGVWSPN